MKEAAAFEALRAALGDISKAKAAVAKTHVHISARTWYKVIQAYHACVRGEGI
jgi:hypothetical protein